jgi:hypothetical protein
MASVKPLSRLTVPLLPRPRVNGMHRGGRRRKLLAPVPKLDMKAGFWEAHSISLVPLRAGKAAATITVQ